MWTQNKIEYYYLVCHLVGAEPACALKWARYVNYAYECITNHCLYIPLMNTLSRISDKLKRTSRLCTLLSWRRIECVWPLYAAKSADLVSWARYDVDKFFLCSHEFFRFDRIREYRVYVSLRWYRESAWKIQLIAKRDQKRYRSWHLAREERCQIEYTFIYAILVAECNTVWTINMAGRGIAPTVWETI